MPVKDGTTIGVTQDIAQRIRDAADREGRHIVAVVERMTDLYEPLTMMDHAILNHLSRESGLTTGQVLSDIIQRHAARQRAQEELCSATQPS